MSDTVTSPTIIDNTATLVNRLKAGVALLILLLFLSFPLSAHEIRPAYLELKETSEETFDVLWKVPGRGGYRLSLYARLPLNCTPVSLQSQYETGDAFIEKWKVHCPGGLTGREITVEGLSATMTDVLFRFQRSDGTTQVTRLKPSSASLIVEGAPTVAAVLRTYVQLGVEHILGGVDHLLFVTALLLMVQEMRSLLKTVTAFTVAHSITLAMATLGFVRVPPAPVEAIIALSIVFVAQEIIHLKQGRDGLTARSPWIVAFTFGLLHGFGFAGALVQIGLPENHIPMALLSFNVGVEIGQLMFIAVLVFLIASGRRTRISVPRWTELIPPYAIGAPAMFWVIQRITAFY